MQQMHQIKLGSHDQFNHYQLIYTHQSKKSIYLGDLTAATNLNFIHSQNIHTVITAALGMDQIDYKDLNINHLKYPFIDNKKENISHFFDDFYDIIEKYIKIGNILVHCSAGISRSPTLVIAYLIKKLKWSFKHAVQFVQSKRKQTMLNFGCQRQLKAYENIIKEKLNMIKQRKSYCLTSEKRKSLKDLQLSGKLYSASFIPVKVQQTIEKYIFEQMHNNVHKINRKIRRNSLLNFSGSKHIEVSQQGLSHSKYTDSFSMRQGDSNNFQIFKIPLHQRFICKKKKLSTLISKKI